MVSMIEKLIKYTPIPAMRSKCTTRPQLYCQGAVCSMGGRRAKNGML